MIENEWKCLLEKMIFKRKKESDGEINVATSVKISKMHKKKKKKN